MKLAIVKKDIAPLYTQPTTQCELGDEALYGMVVELLEEAGEGFYKVRTHYRYEGYVPADCLEENPKLVASWQGREKKVVAVPYMDVLDQPKVQGAHMAHLPRGGLLVQTGEPDKEQWVKVLLADGREGYTKDSYLTEHITSWDKDREEEIRKSLVATAMLYLGTQYRWGGKTPLGIDCSGLCSICYMLNGSIIYRDAKIMPGFEMRQIPYEEAKAGDLLFFPGHVAMYLGEGRFIHSTAHTGTEGVVLNSLKAGDPDYRGDLLESMYHAGTIF